MKNLLRIILIKLEHESHRTEKGLKKKKKDYILSTKKSFRKLENVLLNSETKTLSLKGTLTFLRININISEYLPDGTAKPGKADMIIYSYIYKGIPHIQRRNCTLH